VVLITRSYECGTGKALPRDQTISFCCRGWNQSGSNRDKEAEVRTCDGVYTLTINHHCHCHCHFFSESCFLTNYDALTMIQNQVDGVVLHDDMEE